MPWQPCHICGCPSRIWQTPGTSKSKSTNYSTRADARSASTPSGHFKQAALYPQTPKAISTSSIKVIATNTIKISGQNFSKTHRPNGRWGPLRRAVAASQAWARASPARRVGESPVHCQLQLSPFELYNLSDPSILNLNPRHF